MADVTQVCDRTYLPAFHTSGKRKLSDILWVVLHDEEASTAKSAAMYFQTKLSGGSAHLCVDDGICYRCLENEDVAWGAEAPRAPGGGINHQCFHIEQAGFAKWSAVIWRKHHLTLQRAAYKAALHCKLFGLPVEFRQAADLLARRPGITTHREITKAFGGSHTDPGPCYPMPLFMWWARRYYKGLGN